MLERVQLSPELLEKLYPPGRRLLDDDLADTGDPIARCHRELAAIREERAEHPAWLTAMGEADWTIELQLLGERAAAGEDESADVDSILCARLDWVCRECGCNEEQACVTAAGPCHWVEPDLCSACAEKPRVQLVTEGEMHAFFAACR